MICKFCNHQIDDNAKFCTHCGNSVLLLSQVPANVSQSHATVYEKQKSSNRFLVSLICISVALLATLIIGIVLLINHMSINQTDPCTTQQHATNINSQTEATNLFERYETYSRNYTYKNMPDIHTSIAANNDDCYKMQEFISDYNNLWIEFINYDDHSIFAYLRYNTPAYNYANNYNKKNITEQFELIDVNDVRKSGNFYYVWVHEKLNEYYPNETKYMEYHWVYKIGSDTDGYYVEDYTTDPYYK